MNQIKNINQGKYNLKNIKVIEIWITLTKIILIEQIVQD